MTKETTETSARPIPGNGAVGFGRWESSVRRALTALVLASMTILHVGCATDLTGCRESLVNPSVCPTCSARTVEACRCFLPAADAGYHETQWNRMGTTRIIEHSMPGAIMEPQIIHDTPQVHTVTDAPVMREPPSVHSSAASSRRAISAEATDIPAIRKVAHVVEPSTPEDRKANADQRLATGSIEAGIPIEIDSRPEIDSERFADYYRH